MTEFAQFTGLRNDRPVERFDATDLSVAQNINIDNSGAISMRNGYTQVNTAATHSLWSDQTGTICLYVSGSSLYLANPDMSGTAVMAGLTPNLRMSYWRVLDKVYFSNSQQSGVLENGFVRSWGLPVPSAPGVSVTVGNMPAGTYQTTLTYFRNDGQESGAVLAQPIAVLDGSGLVFTIPPAPSDPTISSVGIYLSTPNSEVPYLALVIPASQSSATYQNDTSELNLPLSTQFMSAPPAGQLVTYYRGRMFVAVDDVIYPSEPHAFELFDLRNYIQMDSRVTMLAPIEDKERSDTDAHMSGFYSGTDRDCGVIVGMDMKDFDYIRKMNYGVIEGAVAYVDGSLYGDDQTFARELPLFLTTQGLCVGMPEMVIKNLTRTRFGFPASGRGACLFQPGSNMFIASSQ